MNLPQDKRQHLVGGAAIALALVGLAWLAVTIGWWLAIAAGSVLAGVGIELYQKLRHEGEPDWRDALATALPGLLLAAALWQAGM